MIVIALEVPWYYLLTKTFRVSKTLNNHPMLFDLELMGFELHQSYSKWLFLGIYKPHLFPKWYWISKKNIFNFRLLLPTYENIVVIGDTWVIPVYKKLDPLKKENYKPVSLLPHVSKVFERTIYQQINTYMKDKLSKCLAGFRKSHGTQYLLVTMLEKWKKSSWEKRIGFCIIHESFKSLWCN